MNEVKHFTKTPEIQHFAEVKVGPNDNVYGVTWAEVVKQYLQTAYSSEDANAEVTAFGKIYKVLRRTEVTAFYDKDGNTLFDVTNERLADEYEWITSNPASETEYDEENISEEGNGDVVAEESENSEEETPADENGEAEKEVEQGESEENGEVRTEADGAVEENTQKSSVYIGIVGATTKLQEELKKSKEKEFAKPVIEYLLERCRQSESLAADICQDHKTWEKCYSYIYEKARKKLNSKSGPVRDDVVFEWAEDYFHLDDKAEEEKKAKEATERKKKEEDRKRKAAEQKKADKKSPKQVAKKEEKVEEKTTEPQKPKKNPKEIDGQMDMFSLMGM